MEAKVNRAWSTAFASGNHQRDVFKESSGDREEEQWVFFTIMVCLNGGYYLFTQLQRATGILFEVTLLIFLPLVNDLAVGKVVIPSLEFYRRVRVMTSEAKVKIDPTGQ